MKKRNLSLLLFMLFFASLYSKGFNNNAKLIKQYNFALKSRNHLEGFSKSLGKNDFSYHSLRPDVTQGLLSRCTDGNMSIEWETQNAAEILNEGLWFTWIAAVDMKGSGQKFDVYVNDVKRFEFISGSNEDRKFDNPEGGILEFTSIELDQHNDAHGYMSIYLPNSWIKPNQSVKIKIVGEAAGSTTWLIVYKASDVISYIQNLAKYETWIKIEFNAEDKSLLHFTAPVTYKNKKLNLRAGFSNYEILLKDENDFSFGKLIINDQNFLNERFIISDENSELIDLPNLQDEIKTQKLLENSILNNEIVKSAETTKIICERIYKPFTVKNLLNLSNSKLSNGQIHLMNSSHQDIAWMDSPEKCVIERDTMLLTPLIKTAIESNPEYRFDIEDALMIKEYIERHPDQKSTIQKLFDDGKISCGSSYIQPYEEMYSGESLIRQFYFGKKWLKDNFNYNAKVYWNVDVPGKVMQMPQILKKSGVDYMIISRFEKGIYNWYSSDDSYITTFSPGHYADAFTHLQKDVYDAANYIAESSLSWENYFADNSARNVIPVFYDWDMSPAKDYSHIIKNWESIDEIEIENGNKLPINLPKFKITTAEEFLDQFVLAASDIKQIKGERPAVWLYIHGPSHYQALKASREADILLTVAEKFSTIDALINQSFTNYPYQRLLKAWESKIYPDHGWGGKEGQITDNFFFSKFVIAKNEAQNIVENLTKSLASKISTHKEKGIPIVIFNSLSIVRSDPVVFEINFDKGKIQNPNLVDLNDESIPIQIIHKENYEDGSLKFAKINFIAENIPSIGYKTFYLINDENKNNIEKTNPYESKFYKIKFGNGGLESIFDKELNVELLDVSKFMGGEIFTMKSEGNGAGEFADIQQPTLEGFDKTSNYATEWKLLENGDVFSSFLSRQKIRNAVVEQKIILYKNIKQIDFDISLENWEGVLYREYRMALPVNIDSAQVSYETAFGVVNVGKDELQGSAGERYTTPCVEIHPRGIENWIGANGSNFGLTLSSCVAVADYIDPTNLNSNKTILQPILLASRKSCHELGNEYLQTGNHFYNFSLTSHKAGWENGFQFGKRANEKLIVVVNPNKFDCANLLEEQSFFSTNKSNVIISTIKKSEDENSIVMRYFDILGKDTNVEILSYIKINSAMSANLIEENIAQIPYNEHSIKIKLGKNSIETIKISPKFE